jgi:hypothetical protein
MTLTEILNSVELDWDALLPSWDELQADLDALLADIGPDELQADLDALLADIGPVEIPTFEDNYLEDLLASERLKPDAISLPISLRPSGSIDLREG